MGNPVTGPKSNSFKVMSAGVLAGLGPLVQQLVENPKAPNGIVMAAGLAASTVSVIAKLFHDHGLNKATLAAAGSDIAAALPQLKADVGTAVSFVEQDFPGVKSFMTSAEARLHALETRVPDLAGIESVVRNVLGNVLAPPPAAAPVAPPAPPTP